MKTFKEQEYTINICTDIIEWAKEFYGMPNGAEVANEDDVSNKCMGFAEIDEKTIWVFLPKEYNIQDLKQTIAHEIGHIIEIKYPYQRFKVSAKALHFSIVQHWHIMYLLSSKGLLPFKIVTFLNNMVKIKILESGGATWRFRHKILQDYFANMEFPKK